MIPNLLTSLLLLQTEAVPTQSLAAVAEIVNDAVEPKTDAIGLALIVGLAQTPEQSVASIAWLAGFAASLVMDMADELGRDPQEYMRSLNLRLSQQFI